MSRWPLITDFSRMLQNPKVAFRDPELKTAAVEKNNLGQPKPRSGNFATVYKGFRGVGQEFAIRVFNRAAAERRERYAAVYDYLQGKDVPCMVNFSYDEKGIRSTDGKMYPLITMDWVPGVTLFEWARQRSREGYQQAFAIAADVWLQLVRDLKTAGIVHGDLQHGNVLISQEGQFKLVDYDCMAVPALMGRRNLEMGMVPYQHPARNAETILFDGLDHFSALVIYVALRALAADTTLWHKYVDEPEYDKMLFRSQDFDNPQQSALYLDLMNSADRQVRDLAHYLFELAKYPIDQVPPLDEVLLWCHSIEDLIKASEWDKAVQLHKRMGPNEHVAPQLMPKVQEAYRRVACKDALEKALESGNDAEIQRCYDPALLDDYPAAAPLVERARMAGQVREILSRLDATKQAGNWPAFIQTYRKHQQQINDLPTGQPYKQEMLRLIRATNVKRLLTAKEADDRAVLEEWKLLEEIGGHPVAEALRPHVAKCAAREKMRGLVRQAPATPNLTYDRELAAGVRAGILTGSSADNHLRTYCEGARQRLKLLDKFQKLNKENTLEAETQIVALAEKLPAGYHAGLPRRVKQAKERMKAHAALVESLNDPVSDMEVVEAHRALERAGGGKLVGEEIAERLELAHQRAPVVRAIRQINRSLALDDYDKRLLTIWKEELLEDCLDAQEYKPRYQQAVERQKLLPQLSAAVEAEDMTAVTRLIGSPALRGYPMDLELAEKIDELENRAVLAQQQQRHSLMQSLIDNERPAFVRHFDIHMLREIAQSHTHHQATMIRWIEEEMLPPEKCGLAAPAEDAVKLEEEERCQIRWKWPESKVTDTCHLVIAPDKKVGAHAIPSDLDAIHTAVVTRQEYDADGCYEVAADIAWHNAKVVVWGHVDAGFQDFFTPPVVLGSIDATPKKSKRWGIF